MSQLSMVPQNMSQQNNGPQSHSNSSTPQSQTPTTPGLHGAPSTPGPQQQGGPVHPMNVGQQASQTPPAQTVMYTGQNIPPHSVSGGFNNQSMVLMQGPHHQNPHGNVVSQGHAMPIPVSVPHVVMQQHYNQNQPSR
jgi:hypothetical protein